MSDMKERTWLLGDCTNEENLTVWKEQAKMGRKSWSEPDNQGGRLLQLHRLNTDTLE